MALNARNLTIVTFKGTSSNSNYDMTTAIKNSNLILVNARVDLDITGLTYDQIPKELLIKIGDTVSNDYVIDNDNTSNYFTYKVHYNPQVIGAATYCISQDPVNYGYKMSGEMTVQTRFTIINPLTQAPISSTLLKYFLFTFQVV